MAGTLIAALPVLTVTTTIKTGKMLWMKAILPQTGRNK